MCFNYYFGLLVFNDYRFEIRHPDGTANPYLMNAVLLAAGLAGVEQNLGK